MKPNFIKVLGLKVKNVTLIHEDGPNCVSRECTSMIRPADLQRALEEKCKVVYGRQSLNHGDWVHIKDNKHTHTAFIFGISEIVKEPMKAEFEATVTMSHGFKNKIYEIEHDELTKFKGKKVRVTVEEIEG